MRLEAMFDVIEKLKIKWTDKYVVVSRTAPELARFAQATGLVKTVNMNGRCLVEFDQFNNTAWYDIDPSSLSMVPKPEPKPVDSKEKKPPAAKQNSATVAPASAVVPSIAKKSSTADILAAARAKTGATPAKTQTPPSAKLTASEKPSGKKLSTADILAKARGTPAAEITSSAPAVPFEPPSNQLAEQSPSVDERNEIQAPKETSSSTKSAASGPLPTSTAEKIAWCRSCDAKA
jgi:hypothetical protein